MQEYVLGFAFSKDKQRVLLIKKKRPEWQKGLLNGIGGKIEKNETAYDAMIREFKEETGIVTEHDDWTIYSVMEGDKFKVCVFSAFLDSLDTAQSMTDEQVINASVKHTLPILNREGVTNLSWLIPMALDENYGKSFIAMVHY